MTCRRNLGGKRECREDGRKGNGNSPLSPLGSLYHWQQMPRSRRSCGDELTDGRVVPPYKNLQFKV